MCFAGKGSFKPSDTGSRGKLAGLPLTVCGSLSGDGRELPVKAKTRPCVSSESDLVTDMRLIFELLWNLIPHLCGNRILKILITSSIDSVFMETLTYPPGEGGADSSLLS